MVIGLVTVAEEDDILERTLAHNLQYVDAHYVLERGDRPDVDGSRQILLDQAYADHGTDHWFLLIHGDEMWTGLPALNTFHDGYNFQLPLHVPTRPWDYTTHPIDQLTMTLGPGYEEFRMFRGGPKVRYDPRQHFNVQPAGLTSVGWAAEPIHHYPYRSPEQNALRARATWDPDNYRGVPDVWTPEIIRAYQSANSCYANVVAA